VDISVSDDSNTSAVDENFVSNSFDGYFRPEVFIWNWVGETKHHTDVTATRMSVNPLKTKRICFI
jgi:hypothetical protein